MASHFKAKFVSFLLFLFCFCLFLFVIVVVLLLFLFVFLLFFVCFLDGIYLFVLNCKYCKIKHKLKLLGTFTGTVNESLKCTVT